MKGSFTSIFVTCLLSFAASGHAGDLTFRRRVISEESEYSAVAVLDVNHDGKLDILCGGFWYKAPTWQRHFVREVERIRGRFDGYSHLPLDVNGDGWTDVVTVNYRSASIRWIEHPGPDLGPWSIHTVEEPGAMETGRLFDIDGDGRVDVLANGQRFAAWWEVRPGADGSAAAWIRNDLPTEIAGHGIGFGDINGDGRGDVVGPTGWAAAPPDRRHGKWVWHQELNLGRASVPVIVVDVDEDGDNDLVWSRAHGFGIYWTEQSHTAEGVRVWTQHTIDSSWSQCHSPLWADMDGDGRDELIAGKRYMAHEGLDPGAYDPLVSYRYQFDPDSRTWQRWVISEGEQVGYGLDPKVVDLDGDDDLDLVVCGRSGLYWLENTGPASPDRIQRETPRYDDHSDLTVWKGADGALRPIETAFDWGRRRGHILASIEQEFGGLLGSKQRVPLDVKVLEEHDDGDVSLQTVSYQSDGERINADVWMPAKAFANAPGLIILSAPATTAAVQNGPATGQAEEGLKELVSRGYVCVVPQLPPRDADEAAEETSQSAGTLRDVWHCLRSVDLLESLPQVNAERIGCVGEGAGAGQALLAAVFDQRIAAIWCSGELPNVSFDSNASTGLHLSELIGAIAPRSLALKVPAAGSAQEKAALERAVEQAAAVFGLYRTAEPPTIEVGATTEEGQRRHDWLDGRLRRSGFLRRSRTR